MLVTGFDAWNGRIVATIKGSPVLDSVVAASVRAHAPLIASAQRTDSTAESARDTCVRDSLSDDLRERAAFVRDSLEQALRDRELPAYERLVNTLHAVSTQVVGCFGNGRRLALAVDLRAGANEWIRERAVLLDTLGDVTPLRVDDYRFKGHDFLAALDADGDGVDDIAAARPHRLRRRHRRFSSSPPAIGSSDWSAGLPGRAGEYVGAAFMRPYDATPAPMRN